MKWDWRRKYNEEKKNRSRVKMSQAGRCLTDAAPYLEPLSSTNAIGANTIVRDGHGGGWSRKINAWHLYTLMVYL